MSNLFKAEYNLNTNLTSEIEVVQRVLHNGTNLVLTGKVATEEHNKPLANATRSMIAKRPKLPKDATQQQRAVELQTILRDVCIKLFPLHVITDWNVVDENGKKVKYDGKRCRDELMARLDKDVVDRIYDHFTNVDKFREVLTATDGAEVGNGSGSA